MLDDYPFHHHHFCSFQGYKIDDLLTSYIKLFLNALNRPSAGMIENEVAVMWSCSHNKIVFVPSHWFSSSCFSLLFFWQRARNVEIRKDAVMKTLELAKAGFTERQAAYPPSGPFFAVLAAGRSTVWDGKTWTPEILVNYYWKTNLPAFAHLFTFLKYAKQIPDISVTANRLLCNSVMLSFQFCDVIWNPHFSIFSHFETQTATWTKWHLFITGLFVNYAQNKYCRPACVHQEKFDSSELLLRFCII